MIDDGGDDFEAGSEGATKTALVALSGKAIETIPGGGIIIEAVRMLHRLTSDARSAQEIEAIKVLEADEGARRDLAQAIGEIVDDAAQRQIQSLASILAWSTDGLAEPIAGIDENVRVIIQMLNDARSRDTLERARLEWMERISETQWRLLAIVPGDWTSPAEVVDAAMADVETWKAKKSKGNRASTHGTEIRFRLHELRWLGLIERRWVGEARKEIRRCRAALPTQPPKNVPRDLRTILWTASE